MKKVISRNYQRAMTEKRASVPQMQKLLNLTSAEYIPMMAGKQPIDDERVKILVDFLANQKISLYRKARLTR